MDNPSNDTQDYGVQPPAIPDDSIANDTTDDNIASDGDTSGGDVLNDATSAVPPTDVSSTISSEQLPIINDIIGKIDEANNILVALSSDPSVDELATAIALSLSLDRLEKRVTAIYSGETPDALSFLKPEETFEAKPDTLQDFVIALNKDKADHLRYKVDGDYVKIFITPYRSRISEEDLEFSYGDFNVDLVIALDVANGVDLDSALREHGRIMHDATIINITTAKPGKLGEIEWSDTRASSVSEMVAELLLIIGKIEKPEATALLTGIISATDRFANSHTTPHSLEIASRLISAGANQQLVAKNIASELDGNNLTMPKAKPASQEKISIADSIREKAIAKENKNDDPMSLDIRHHDEEEPTTDTSSETTESETAESETSDSASVEPEESESKEPEVEESEESASESISGPVSEDETEDEALTEDLEATEATLSNAGAEVVPEAEKKSFSLEVNSAPKISKHESNEPSGEEPSEEASPEEESSKAPSAEDSPEDSQAEPVAESQEETDQPSERNNDEDGDGIVGPFGSDDDEEENENPEPETPANDFLSDKAEKIITPPSAEGLPNATSSTNPATTLAPDVASAPEANNIPNMDYMPMPNDEILPPPPTPPVDFNAEMPPLDQATPNAQPSASASMPDMAQPASPEAPNPFLNPMSAQNPLLSNTPASSPMSNMGSPMPQMHSANPFATPPSMPGANPNPFATQPTMPNQPGMPGQMSNNQPTNNPGSFQIPGM